MRLQRLEVDRDGPVARVWLSGDPLGSREANELAAVGAELADDRSLRVVLLQSRGVDFCPDAGGDLDPSAVDPTTPLAAIRCPVIARLHGRTGSAGLEIALVCDIRIAAPDARFAMPDVALGRLPQWGGTQRLVRVVGRPAALEMLLLGGEWEAARALSRGLVHEVHESAAARVEGIVEALLALGPLALEYAKEAVWRGAELPMREALALEGDLNHLLQASADRDEGIRAFLDKRDPRFEGR